MRRASIEKRKEKRNERKLVSFLFLFLQEMLRANNFERTFVFCLFFFSFFLMQIASVPFFFFPFLLLFYLLE